MKILFVLGSLEPGRDGVGDYTHALASECSRLGHETLSLSLNDPWIDRPAHSGCSYRLPSRMLLTDRIKTARAIVSERTPDLVSLQFAPYSFHPAGLSFALPQILRAIFGQTPVQIMLHELWIGAQIGAPRKVRVLGFCQRKIIEALVKRLACRAIHTSNYVYVQLLSRHRINAKLLPLFGSIPITQSTNVSEKDANSLRIGIFGSIHREWSPEELFIQLRSLGKSIQFFHIGRIASGETVWDDMVERYQSEIQFYRLGEQPKEDISKFLSAIDFGIATAPLSLIGKSSCIAAMIDHGLPVIVTRNDIQFQSIPAQDPVSEPLLIPLDSNFLKRLKEIRRRIPEPRLPQVAAKFLSDITIYC